MEHSNGYTEQCQDWSDRCTERLNCKAAHAAAPADQAAARPRPASHPRLPHHAVHALWQTALPLCGRARPWAQVLSLGEPSGEAPPPHLCTQGYGSAGAAAGGPVADVSHPPGGAVRDRLRVAQATRRPVARSYAVGQPSPSGGSNRRGRRRSTGGQHAGTGPESGPLAKPIPGGHAPCTRR
jgi:hypothetical protein